jgi:antitoxin (DNA-binding transcriptional repressor) of toxin-antitoxin stability system
MAQFSVDDATANLSRLIAEALASREVVITRGNVQVVRLVPKSPCGRRCFDRPLKGRDLAVLRQVVRPHVAY